LKGERGKPPSYLHATTARGFKSGSEVAKSVTSLQVTEGGVVGGH